MASAAVCVGDRSRLCGVCLVALVLVGCGSAPRAEVSEPQQDLSNVTDPVLLRQDLAFFASSALADVAGTANSIAAATDDPRVREQTLRWKIDMDERLSAAVASADSRRNFLELWLVVAREGHATKEGRKGALFGDQQQKAVEAIERQSAQIQELGYAHFPAEVIDAARDDVEKAASGQISETSPFVTPTPGTGALALANDVGRLLTVPLAPFRGVADTPTAISQLASSTESFTTVTRDLPRRIRWELELLLLEMESLESTIAVRGGIQRTAQTFQELSSLLDSLPQEVGAEVRSVVQALAQNQPELHATLVEARQTATELNQGLSKTQGVLQQMSQVGGDVSATADAWQKTATAVGQLLADWREYQDSLPPRESHEKEATAADYAEIAKEVRQAVAETRALLNEVRETGRDSATIGHLSAELTGLMNALTLRLLLLIGVVFAAAIAFRVVWRRIDRRGDASRDASSQA